MLYIVIGMNICSIIFLLIAAYYNRQTNKYINQMLDYYKDLENKL